MVAKRSFIIHVDSLSVLKKLKDEQAGKLFKTIALFHEEGLLPEDELISIVFEPFLNQFLRDSEKYKNITERNKLNGSKGGRPKNPVGYLGTQENPKKPKKADSVSDSDNVFISSLLSEIKLGDDLWKSFLEHRKKVRASLTLEAQKLVLEKLRSWKEKGHDPELIIKNSIENGWKGVFEPKQEISQKPKQIHNNFKKQDYYAGTEGFNVD